MSENSKSNGTVTINENQKYVFDFDYEFYKGLDFDVKKDFKRYFLWSNANKNWVSKAKFPAWNIDKYIEKFNLKRTEVKEFRGDEDLKEKQKEFAKKRESKFQNKAKKAISKAESLQSEFNKYRKDWAWLTQPNTQNSAGRRFASQRDKIVSRYEKGFAEYAKSDYYLERANTARLTAEIDRMQEPFYLEKKIKERKTSVEKLNKWVPEYLEKAISSNDQKKIFEAEAYFNRLKKASEDLAFYSKKLEDLKQTSFVPSKESLKNAEYVLYKNSWHKLLKLNPKTATITWFVGTWKTPYSKLTDFVNKGDNFTSKPIRFNSYNQPWLFEIQKPEPKPAPENEKRIRIAKGKAKAIKLKLALME